MDKTPSLSASQLASTPSTGNHQSMEAIMALNIGDFLVEHFISDDLLSKINTRVGQDSQKLIRQLKELIELYTVEKTLGILGGKGVQDKDLQNGQNQTLIQYNDIAQTLTQLFQVDRCHLFLKIPSIDHLASDQLTLAGTSIALSAGTAEALHFSTQSKNLLVDIYLSSQPDLYEVKGKDRLNWKPFSELKQDESTSVIACPLRDSRKPVGILLLESSNPIQGTPEMIALAQVTSRIFVTATRLHQLLRNTQRELNDFSGNHNELVNLRAQITDSIADLGIDQHEFLDTLARCVDARHQFSQGHSQRIANLARSIAETMDLNEKTADLLYYAGCLTGLGRLHIHEDLLTKEGALSPEERKTVAEETQSGASLLSRIHFLSEVIPYLSTYLERWDGSGGPQGLSGRSIPLGSRILAVANGYEALTSVRPYRPTPLTHEAALAVLQKEAGQKWDPTVVKALDQVCF